MKFKRMGLPDGLPLFLYAPNDDDGTPAVEDPPVEEPTPDEEPDKDPPEEEEKPVEKADPPAEDPYEAFAKSQGLTVEEVKARLAYQPPAEEPTKTPETPVAPVDVPDFRSQAYEEAFKYPQFTETDEYGETTLTVAGVQWAENRAMRLHVEDSQAKAETQARSAQLVAKKPEIAKHYEEHFKSLGVPVPEEVASQVATDFTDLAVSYGLQAFDESTPEAAKASEKLRTNAYYVALGMQKERELKAAMEGGDAGDKAPEPARGGGGSGAGLYEGISKTDQDWLKNTWAKEQNGGKPPTREQIAELKKRGAI